MRPAAPFHLLEAIGRWAALSRLERAQVGRALRHRKNRLLHGVCRVRMRRATDAWHRTLVWIDVVAAALAGKAAG